MVIDTTDAAEPLLCDILSYWRDWIDSFYTLLKYFTLSENQSLPRKQCAGINRWSVDVCLNTRLFSGWLNVHEEAIFPLLARWILLSI